MRRVMLRGGGVGSEAVFEARTGVRSRGQVCRLRFEMRSEIGKRRKERMGCVALNVQELGRSGGQPKPTITRHSLEAVTCYRI